MNQVGKDLLDRVVPHHQGFESFAISIFNGGMRFTICSASGLFMALIKKQAFSLSEKSSPALSRADVKSW